MALRRFCVAGAGLTLLVGCANDARTKSTTAPTGAAALPTYRTPASIRPADSAFAVSKVDPTPAPVAAAATPARVVGEWAPSAKPRAWKYIVLHHSASPSGNAAVFDREHKAKGWDELGYHFVIDNGRGGPDGRIEVGPRWLKQKWGAHAKTPDNKYNDFGIGICFVGNFENGRPTAKQLASAARLVAWLEQTYDIKSSNVIGHEDTGKQTLCPGKYLSVAQVKTAARQAIADAASATPTGDGDGQPIHARVAMSDGEVELLQTR